MPDRHPSASVFRIVRKRAGYGRIGTISHRNHQKMRWYLFVIKFSCPFVNDFGFFKSFVDGQPSSRFRKNTVEHDITHWYAKFQRFSLTRNKWWSQSSVRKDRVATWPNHERNKQVDRSASCPTIGNRKWWKWIWPEHLVPWLPNLFRLIYVQRPGIPSKWKHNLPQIARDCIRAIHPMPFRKRRTANSS